MHRTYFFITLIALFLAIPHLAFGACDLDATTSNFASQLAAAQPGQTVCLATGNYGSFAGVSKSSPGVTIAAAAGATPSMGISFRQTSPVAAWLIFDGITFTGGSISGPAHDITFKNSTFVNQLTIYASAANNACSNCPAMNNNNIVFDNDVFNMAANQSGGGGYEGRIQFTHGGSTPAGITIKNSKFTSGCADGIQIGGTNSAYGVTIGPNNEFYNLMQGGCGPHVDSIQLVGTGAVGPTITGNYFHDNTTGITTYDYQNHAVVTNNVFVNVVQDVLGGFSSPNSIIAHNTVVGNSIGCNITHQGDVCRSQIFDNIATSINLYGNGQPSVNDYNLCTSGGCVGSHSLNGTPTYVGGTKPTTYAGYALTATSLGRGAASDGKDIGINTTGTGTGTPPLPPTNPTAVAH
jgi:hypothetical protein